jgi:adenosylcobinamide-phosphate synthase
MIWDLLAAVALDILLGDPPDWPHPVKLMGRLIAFEERLLRQWATRAAEALPTESARPRQKRLFYGGLLMVLVNLGLTLGLAYGVLHWLRPYPISAHLVNSYLLYTCLAARCLRDEAVKVYQALSQGLPAARMQLARIVGRDTTQLDEPEIIRATVETIAENTSDGVIAPLLYALIGGAPLALVYKMVNTMDSMVGYVHEKYRDIGFFPAKTDDLWNWIPARLTAVLMLAGGLVWRGFAKHIHLWHGVKILWRDRRQHKSPNCGYPESAVAGLLGIQLGGTNVYFGQALPKPTLGDPLRPLIREDIPRTVSIMFLAEGLLVVLILFGNWMLQI